MQNAVALPVKSNKKKRKKKIPAPVRLQGYFTKRNVAFRLAEYINHHITGPPIKSAIDPSGGTGYLLAGLLDAQSPNHPRPTLHMVEPVAPTDREAPYNRIKKKIGLFHMTLEEWCLTYAEKDAYELWLSNPPFNERLGTTQLGEHCHKLFREDIKLFETLFFLVGSVVASRYMAYIVPDSYFSKAEARPTMERLAGAGWTLLDVRALPLDACYNSLENMSFLFFEKREPVSNWIEPALSLLQTHTAPPLFKNRPVVTITAIHGPRTGYLLKGAKTDQDSPQGLDLARYFEPQDGPFNTRVAPFDWTPQARKEGDVWNRQGCVYELTPVGWEPANSGGYCDGRPVNEQFDQARAAYRFMDLGAFFTANALLEPLNLESLREQYQQISGASFLMLLSKGRTVENPFIEDLKRLGMLKIKPEHEPQHTTHPSIERVSDYIVCRDTLSPAQACALFVEVGEVPPWVYERVTQAVSAQMIPMDKITLRAPWIPRPLIARFLGCKLDSQGLYVGKPYSLTRYLNYGKAGPIQEQDKDIFEVESRRFAVAVNNWDEPEHADIRPRIHAHYVSAHAPQNRVIEAVAEVETAPGVCLHPWQRDDIGFYLSGATISNLDVGVGKTLTALAAAVAYTKGTPRKALIAVPKQVLMKWARELEMFFPGVGFHILGFYKNRKGKTARRPQKTITAEAQKVFWDPSINIILTSHQVIGDFQLRPEEEIQADTQNAYDQLGTELNKTTEKARAQFIKKSAERSFEFGGDLTWSDLPHGLFVVIDEAHNYKNLFPMPSQGWGESLIMAGTASESKRARDLQIKLDIARKRGGKTLALTATLISNSVAEIYNMLRIFSPHVLEQQGITNTQQVIDSFCILEHVISSSLTGRLKEGQTITGFKNLDVLRDMWEKTTRTYTAGDVGLAVPDMTEVKEIIPPTPQIADFMDEWKALLESAVKQRNAPSDDDERELCIFDLISKLDKVAAFPPLVGIDGENPKLDRLVLNVKTIMDQCAGGQIIFADMKEVQTGIKARLMAEGIPESQVVIVNASTAPQVSDRLSIADRFNDGEYRIIIGGKVISEGVDLQRNTQAGHFVNLSWEGATLHQRIGRLVRQGNQTAKVKIYYYLLDESTDIYRFLTIQRKTHWSEHLRTSQTDTITKGIFAEAIDDDFICSLASNKEKMRAILKNARVERELFGQVETAEKTLKTMLDFANPATRAVCLEILQRYESKLRALDLIPKPVIDEGLTRVQTLAHIQHSRFKAAKSSRQWEAWARDVRAIQSGTHQQPFSFSDLFELHATTEDAPRFDTPLQEMIKPDVLKLAPSFFPSFGASTTSQANPEKTTPKTTQPAYNVIMLDRRKPTTRPAPTPRAALAVNAADTSRTLARALELLKTKAPALSLAPKPKANPRPVNPIKTQGSHREAFTQNETSAKLTRALARLRQSAKRPKPQAVPAVQGAAVARQMSFDF